MSAVKRRGRPPKYGVAMTSTERSLSQYRRLKAAALYAEQLRIGLLKLHGEMEAAGLGEWAERVLILRNSIEPFNETRPAS